MSDSQGSDQDPGTSETTPEETAPEETTSEIGPSGPGAPPAAQTAPPPPPHPLDKQWRIVVDRETYGPYTGHQLKAYIEEGRVTRDTTVASPGTHVWYKASDDRILGPLFDRKEAKASQARAKDASTIVQVSNMPPPAINGIEQGPKSPGIALLLSLLITGVGQMYNGEVVKGILMLIGCVILWFFWLGWVIWIWSMIDAYQGAKNVNAAYRAYLRRQESRRGGRGI